MPLFRGHDRRVVTIGAPMERVVAAMTDPEQIKGFIAELDFAERIDAQTYRWVYAEVNEKGVRFRGDQTVRYVYDGEGRLEWSSISSGNMSCEGHARFTAAGVGATTVDYSESIVCEMQVNRILAAVIKRIVERKISNGVASYLLRIKTRLEAQQ